MRLRILDLCAASRAAPPRASSGKSHRHQRSTITIHVGKSGLLSAAAHDHTIDAPISSGDIQESPHRT